MKQTNLNFYKFFQYLEKLYCFEEKDTSFGYRTPNNLYGFFNF